LVRSIPKRNRHRARYASGFSAIRPSTFTVPAAIPSVQSDRVRYAAKPSGCPAVSWTTKNSALAPCRSLSGSAN
jgi:hypothetical protein